MGKFDEDNEETKGETKGEPIPLSSLKQKTQEEEDETLVQKDIDIKKKQTDNKATLNIKDINFIKDFVKEPTKNAETGSSSSTIPPKSNETVEDIRARLAVEEKEEVGKLSVEDFEDAADFIIDLIDMALLFGVRWYSQDISDAEYKVPEDKLKKLKKHLSRLLMRMGKKFPMGILFVLGILAAYATPIRKAHEHRKKVMAEKTRKKISKETEKEKEKEKESEDEEEDKPTYVPLKKKRGGNAK